MRIVILLFSAAFVGSVIAGLILDRIEYGCWSWDNKGEL